MKIKLQTEQIRDFFVYAKNITTEAAEITPVIRYIKVEIDFGFCTLYKSNNNSFVKYTFKTKEDDCVFLIAEEKLQNFATDTKEREIIISIKDDEITLSDNGGRFKQRLNKTPYSLIDFPKIPEIGKEKLRLDKDVLNAMNIAKVHTIKDEININLTAVHFSEEGYIYSGNFHSLYIRNFSKKIPKVSIKTNESTILCQFPYLDYVISDNYNTYTHEGITYGFIQQHQITGFNYNQFLDKIRKDNYIIISLEDLEMFCQSTVRFTNDSFCESELTVINEETAKLTYIDHETSQENTIECKVKLYGEQFSFTFNPSFFLPIIKALRNVPYSEIYLGDEGSLISIWNEGDKNYTGILNKLNKAK